jgi:putative PIN family toxin of toxin-antitoxin system
MATSSLPRVVIDTSVLVAASRSRRGASFEIVKRIPGGLFEPALSVALYAEWQQALSRPENRPPEISPEMAAEFLQYVASQSHLQDIYFLWRPVLKDPNDDMVLELAVASQSQAIITHNVADFVGADRFGVEVMMPAAFLQRIRGDA